MMRYVCRETQLLADGAYKHRISAGHTTEMIVHHPSAIDKLQGYTLVPSPPFSLLLFLFSIAFLPSFFFFCISTQLFLVDARSTTTSILASHKR